MDTSKLLEYLSIIIDLEKDKYTQAETIKQLNSNISSYKNEYQRNDGINKKVLLRSQTASDDDVNVDESGKGIMYFMVYYVGFFGAWLGYIVYFFSRNFIISLIGAAIGAVLGGSIPVMVWKNILKKRRERAIIQRNRGIRADVELSQNRQSRNNEIAVLLPRVQAEKDNMQKIYDLTCKTLKKCYEADIIPADYRNIVPVCMFYDYILNGRTYSIKRNPQAFDEGAINMYEDELRKREILNKLDQILCKLNEISQNQRVLHNAIQEGNRKTHELLNNINSNVAKVNSNLQTIQYQNECSNKCLQYMSYVTYQRYMSR